MTEPANTEKAAGKGPARIIYILYLFSIFIGITAIVGLIMAYVNRDDAPDWLKTHYRFQIRTFWIGALYLFTGLLFAQFFIGVIILLFTLLWLIVRCAKGFKYLDRGQAYPNPTGWWF